MRSPGISRLPEVRPGTGRIPEIIEEEFPQRKTEEMI
jgi:hypothetical protein